MLSDAQNDALSAFPTMEEIHDVMKSMNGHSAAGPDGFNGCFHTLCWDIIKYDLYEAVAEFLAGGSLLKA